MGLLFHNVAAVAACGLIWALLNVVRRSGRSAATVVVWGFLVRAFTAQILFWISYLHLPIARSLQLGDGFWFCGLDGTMYVSLAERLATSGWRPFLAIDRTLSSPLYVQVLGFVFVLFGAGAFVAVLLNLFSYLAIALILCRWGQSGSDVSKPALAGLIALTFSPAGLLWASQPMKDTFIAFLTVLFVGGCAAWQSWQQNDAQLRSGRPFLILTAMAAAIYVLAGIRWYFAAMVWVSSFAFFIFMALSMRRQRIRTTLTNLAAFVLLSQPFAVGAGPSLPPAISDLLHFRRAGASAANVASEVQNNIVESRRGFERTPAATMIGVGKALRPAIPRKNLPAVARPGQSVVPPALASSRPAESVTTQTGGALALPTTLASRLFSGYVAMIVPHVIAERLGLIHVGGGRGLWLFADVDTLVFDAVLLFALFSCVVWLRFRFRTVPVLWQVLMTGMLISGAIAYTVTNFGTLFRHRNMVYVALCLVPVAVSTAIRPRRGIERTPCRRCPGVD